MNPHTSSLVITLTIISVQGFFSTPLNREKFVYINPNIAQNEENGHLHSTKFISKGTIILIERPHAGIGSLISKKNSLQFLKKRVTKMHLSWNGFLFSTMPLLKIGFFANIEIYQNYEGDNSIIAVTIADIKPRHLFIRPMNLVKVLLHSTKFELSKLSFNEWITVDGIHLDDADKRIIFILEDCLRRLFNQFKQTGSDKQLLLNSTFMNGIYENKAGQEVIHKEESYFGHLHHLMFIIFDRIHYELNDPPMDKQIRALIDNQEMYTILCKDSEFVKWFFDLHVPHIDDVDSKNDILQYLDGIYYRNSKVDRNFDSGQLQVTGDIKMGTILLIEEPCTCGDSNAEILIQDTDNLMYYSSLALMQLGLHANIAISKDEIGNVFIMSTCDLAAGEYLIKPIEFLKALKMDDGNLSIREWRKGIEERLTDQDTLMLRLLWKFFVGFADYRYFNQDAFEEDEMGMMLLDYQMVCLSLHQHGFNPSDWQNENDASLSEMYLQSLLVCSSNPKLFEEFTFLYKKLHAVTLYFRIADRIKSDDLRTVLYPLFNGDEEFAAYIRKRGRQKYEDTDSDEPIAKHRRLETHIVI